MFSSTNKYVSFARSRMRMRRVFGSMMRANAYISGMIILWITFTLIVNRNAIALGDTFQDIGSYIGVALGSLSVLVALLQQAMIGSMPRGDTEASGDMARVGRFVVLRRFDYALDLQSISSLLPTLCTLGQPVFVRSRINRMGVSHDHFTRDAPSSFIGHLQQSIKSDAAVARESAERAYKEKWSNIWSGAGGGGILPRFMLHPATYAMQILPRNNCIQVFDFDDSSWVSGVYGLITSASFVVIDITGVNANVELEMRIAFSAVSMDRIILICRSPTYASDGVVHTPDGHEVFLYEPSMFGDSRVGEYIISRVESVVSGEGDGGHHEDVHTPSLLADGSISSLLTYADEGLVASQSPRREIHGAFLTAIVSLIVLTALLTLIASLSFHAAKISGIGLALFCGMPAAGLVLVSEYLTMLFEWRRSVRSDAHQS